MKQVFLIGAGYVAGQAAMRLIERGHRVVIGKRRPDQGLTPALTAQAAVHAMDVGAPERFPSSLFEADTIVYCVASDGFTPAQYRAAYSQGLAHVLGALGEHAHAACRRLIFVSSTGVYSQNDGSRIDENSNAQPTAFSGQIMREAEEHLQAYCAAHPAMTGCALRFSGIYGPGRTRMVEEIRSGKPVSAQRWSQYTNRIHRDDCAAALVHLVEREQIAPVYVASDMQPARFGEIATWMAARLGVAPPPVNEPEASPPGATSPNGARSSGGLERGGHKQCWSTGLLAEGFRFRYPSFREGYGALLENRS